MDINEILKEYDLSLVQCKTFELKMKHLLSELLNSREIKIHNITSRVKERSSLQTKINSKNKYSTLLEITDVIGVRIVTFFEDEVDIVAEMISEEFVVDKPNSVDKRVVEYNKFGYASLHYVASLNNQRCKLSEYSTFSTYKFEIQIRSILQHAWAEIEHDIGYKSKGSIPDVVKRNFSRVAALLETSDLEFTKLRDRLLRYETEVDSEIKENPKNVDLNNISLQSFAQTNPLLNEIDKELSNCVGTALLTSDTIDIAEIPKLKYLGIENIEQLSKVLSEKRVEIISFTKEFVGENFGGSWNRGISLFYLAYLLIAERNNKEDITKIINKFWGNGFVGLTDELMNIYKKIKE